MYYTLYKGDKIIAVGTLDEIAETTNKSRRNLQSILSRTKRDGLMHRKHNQLMLVPESDDGIKEDIKYHLHKIQYHVEVALDLDGFDGYKAKEELEAIKNMIERAVKKTCTTTSR